MKDALWYYNKARQCGFSIMDASKLSRQWAPSKDLGSAIRMMRILLSQAR